MPVQNCAKINKASIGLCQSPAKAPHGGEIDPMPCLLLLKGLKQARQLPQSDRARQQ